MTRKEFAILVKGMKTVYADPKFINGEDAIEIWYAFFKEDDYDTVQAAIQQYIANNEFAPTVAGIRKYMAQITVPEDDISEGYAWSLVYKAICNSNYCAKEEFEKLPEICQTAVGHFENLKEWAMLKTDEVNTVIHSNFLRGFRAARERKKEMSALPCRMQEQIRKIIDTHTPTMIEGGGHND